MSAPNPKHLTLRSMPLKSLIPVSSLNKTSAGVATGIIASSPPIYGKKWVPRMRANNSINKKTNPIPISGGGGGGGGGGMSRVRALIPGTDFGGLRKSVVQKIWEGWGVITLAGFSGSTPPGDAKRGNTDSNINSSNNNRRRKTTTANFRRVPAPGPLMGSHKIKEEEEGQGQQKGNNTHLQNPAPSHSSKFLTLPTILTLGRVAAVPLLVSIFYLDGRWATTITTGIFIAAAITDWLDGYIARKMRLGSAFGAFLDPVADKLMVAATLVLLCTRPLEVATFGKVPWLLTVPTIAIIGREITMSAVREWAASQNSKVLEAVAVNNLGKWKTATQMIALTILLVARDCSLTGSGVLVSSGVVLLYISSWLAVWSLAVYMKKIWRVLLK